MLAQFSWSQFTCRPIPPIPFCFHYQLFSRQGGHNFTKIMMLDIDCHTVTRKVEYCVRKTCQSLETAACPYKTQKPKVGEDYYCICSLLSKCSPWILSLSTCIVIRKVSIICLHSETPLKKIIIPGTEKPDATVKVSVSEYISHSIITRTFLESKQSW